MDHRRLPELNQHRDEVLTYIQQNWHNADPAVRDALDRFTHDRGDGQMTTYWDAAVEEGFAKGEAKGLEQGLERGRADLLLQQLRLKFLLLSARAAKRVSAASAAQLDAWAEAALSATSLDEVFARQPKPKPPVAASPQAPPGIRCPAIRFSMARLGQPAEVA